MLAVVIFGTVCGVYAPSLQSRAIDMIAGTVTGSFAKTLIFMLVVYLLYSGSQLLQGLLSAKISQRIVKRMREELFGKIVDLPVRYLDTHSPVSYTHLNYCGAIVGRLYGHTAAHYTDNYYLDTSAPNGFGSGSDSTTASAPTKTAAQFESGEVCYLVNSETSTGGKAIWKQDIDNGNTPYDRYPVFDAAAVYFRSDDTYSNDPEQISVTIS